MTDLIVMSLESWDGVWRRNQHLVSRLLRADEQLRVLFVAPSADPLHDVRSRRRPALGHRPRPVHGVADGRLWTFRPLKALPRSVDDRADERIADQVIRAARALGMQAPLLWLNDPGAVALATRSGWPTLYDITDDWLAAARSAAELERIGAAEEHLLHAATEVVVCSPELLRRKSPARPADRHPITVIRNAVDTAEYLRPRPRPADLPPGSVVYVGTLHRDRLDVDLCAGLAQEVQPHGTLVLVGPNALSREDTQRLGSAGAALLGPRAHTDVVAYLQHADVLVVPHVVTGFTDSLDPIKLYEYSAVGRPVVSTAVAGFRDAGTPQIRIADRAEFASTVRLALAPAPTADTGGGTELVADWDERAYAMGAVIHRMAAE